MKSHLIVLDLDGTLLNDKKVISEKTLATLKQAESEGHQIMIATGRPYRSSEIYYRQLGLKTPIVNFNGAFVHHPTDRTWKTVHETIDLSVAKDVVDAMADFNLKNIVAEVMDDVYLHYHDEKLLDIFSSGSPKIQEGDIRQLLQVNPTSLLIQGGKGMADPIRKHLEEVHAEVIEHRRWGAPWEIVEVIRHGLNKAVGISKVSEWIGIPQERIIAFGDEDNDLEMIDYAGIGVAMGNGIDQLKSIANEVTLTNNEDGIAIMLQERLNLKTL
ncbi:HAD family phosphatase [Sporosarcina sp. BI001-red]|uniref:Cof-type HAD-IIB family hydrolase n=1 Tax=Sporosarcina sp. BI001-red TaxID=2282866 RepID=UPI000E23D382|nr:Cof-type HAD-IIB family hydrolase [Sporosarcina sp. BI001-red]REB11193.1 HAD family phosphatase [Sporosarcina sp. BI001-red]